MTVTHQSLDAQLRLLKERVGTTAGSALADQAIRQLESFHLLARGVQETLEMYREQFPQLLALSLVELKRVELWVLENLSLFYARLDQTTAIPFAQLQQQQAALKRNLKRSPEEQSELTAVSENLVAAERELHQADSLLGCNAQPLVLLEAALRELAENSQPDQVETTLKTLIKELQKFGKENRTLTYEPFRKQRPQRPIELFANLRLVGLIALFHFLATTAVGFVLTTVFILIQNMLLGVLAARASVDTTIGVAAGGLGILQLITTAFSLPLGPFFFPQDQALYIPVFPIWGRPVNSIAFGCVVYFLFCWSKLFRPRSRDIFWIALLHLFLSTAIGYFAVAESLVPLNQPALSPITRGMWFLMSLPLSLGSLMLGYPPAYMGGFSLPQNALAVCNSFLFAYLLTLFLKLLRMIADRPFLGAALRQHLDERSS